MTANTSQALNFIRSATAPEINATAMIANADWKATNARVGIVPETADSLIRPVSPANSSGLPTSPLPPIESPNVRL
jgi:hypothetical protein